MVLRWLLWFASSVFAKVYNEPKSNKSASILNMMWDIVCISTNPGQYIQLIKRSSKRKRGGREGEGEAGRETMSMAVQNLILSLSQAPQFGHRLCHSWHSVTALSGSFCKLAGLPNLCEIICMEAVISSEGSKSRWNPKQLAGETGKIETEGGSFPTWLHGPWSH